jgi:hypothetical protein
MANWFRDKERAASDFRFWGIQELYGRDLGHENKIFVENGESTEIISDKIFYSVIGDR